MNLALQFKNKPISSRFFRFDRQSAAKGNRNIKTSIQIKLVNISKFALAIMFNIKKRLKYILLIFLG